MELKIWHIAINNQQQGPFGMDELLQKGLTQDTLVWKAGMPSWVKAKDVAELVGTFKPAEPVKPMSYVEAESPKASGNNNFLTAGLILLVIVVIVIAVVFGVYFVQKEKELEQARYRAEQDRREQFTDGRDGKTYRKVKIGSQVWMAENLNYDANGSKCYDNNPENCRKYGRLYNWETAMKACPGGWHLPSDAEWTTLTNYVGGADVAGSKLKAKSGWNDNGNGTDDYGFSALPGGRGYSDGSFIYVESYGYWWSASKNNASIAYYRYMDYYNSLVSRYNINKTHLLSVRCLQD
ncbi:MAG: GYF domain-containing protein [Fibromonadales bacterium]|nr:GYF domain-containing protein [Fibromonadales bacterium]